MQTAGCIRNTRTMGTRVVLMSDFVNKNIVHSVLAVLQAICVTVSGIWIITTLEILRTDIYRCQDSKGWGHWDRMVRSYLSRKQIASVTNLDSRRTGKFNILRRARIHWIVTFSKFIGLYQVVGLQHRDRRWARRLGNAEACCGGVCCHVSEQPSERYLVQQS